MTRHMCLIRIVKDVNGRGIGIILSTFPTRNFQNFTQWLYNRCTESGYTASKFIVLRTCVKRDSRIRQLRVNGR